MAVRRRLRENSRSSSLLTDGWSRWEKALVPLDENREYRGNTDQDGLMCSSIKYAFPDDCCGIYEWKAVGTFRRQPRDVVVYVGSACRRNRGGLRSRILEYCTSGSHKKDLINEALHRGYELWVSVKTVDGWHRCEDRDVEDMENELLNRYDYAWNVRNNVEIRYILPRP